MMEALGFCDRASWANCEVREKTNKMHDVFDDGVFKLL